MAKILCAMIRGNRWRAGFVLAVAGVLALTAPPLRANEAPKSSKMRLAALALPIGANADWQQWDSFLTNVVKKLGESFQPTQQEQLGDAFLDARYQLVQALSSGSSDPVPQLF